MSHVAPHFESFLRAVHRRFVLVRLVESAGAGMLAGCAAAAVLLPLLMWTGTSALRPAAAVVVLGAVAGAAWGATRRPSALAAAMEADRQLELADLLSTAVNLREPAGDPWRATVLAIADARCRQHSPSQVILHRYGSRAWGGVALATAAVLTMAALFAPTGEQAAVASGEAGTAAKRIVASAESPARPRGMQGPRGTTSPRAADAGRTSGEPVGVAPDTDAARESNSHNSTSAGTSRGAGTSGQGGGRGTSGQPRRPGGIPDAPPPSTPPSDRNPGGSDAATVSGAGGTQTGGTPAGNGSVEGMASASSGGAEAAAPWESTSWPSDARDARDAGDAVESGRVPDAYRDLVRDYFDRR